MKLLLILFFILNINITQASENIFFKEIPSYSTRVNAIMAVNMAALSRKWTAHEFENNKLRIELNHKGYKAALEFYFSEKEILYSDLTTYYVEAFDEFSEGAWVEKQTPEHWIANLKKDTGIYFLKNQSSTELKAKLDHENIKIKLKSLQSLYNEKLITEAEYKLRKKKIMSVYDYSVETGEE